MSTDHTDPGPLEGLIPPEMLLTMNGGEPAIVCLRVEDLDLDAALGASHDMGLPVALAPDVSGSTLGNSNRHLLVVPNRHFRAFLVSVVVHVLQILCIV